jgi:hypothetical protein
VVTITGLHLQNVSKVEFISGSVIGIGRHVVDVNAKEVRVTSPTGSPDDNPYDITVTNPHGTSATNTGDEFTYTADPSPGKIFVHTSNLSFDEADNLNITGRGWTPGLLILVTICNADASNISPFVQIVSRGVGLEYFHDYSLLSLGRFGARATAPRCPISEVGRGRTAVVLEARIGTGTQECLDGSRTSVSDGPM